ncbi:hypothetical protein ACFVQ3_08895 [Oerskovia sp. NPDC057915]|uniref:hypothetical protein n=1 Tax=Oerskovia sp. NPDC057915 TaxID=3346280 RepID=UPI0036DC4887
MPARKNTVPPARTEDAAPPVEPGDPATATAARPVTVDAVRRVHVSEDWLATVVGLAIVAVGLLGLIPEGLVP